MTRKASSTKFLKNNPGLRAPRMEHIRSIKPEFFTHEGVAALSPLTRLAWVGVWTQADKFGRFPWRPKWLKTKVLPYDDVDFDAVLGELMAAGFIEKYTGDGEDYGSVVHWSRHQGLGTHEQHSTYAYPGPVNSSGTVQEQFVNRANPVGVGVGVGVEVGVGVNVKVEESVGVGEGVGVARSAATPAAANSKASPAPLPAALKAAQEKQQEAIEAAWLQERDENAADAVDEIIALSRDYKGYDKKTNKPIDDPANFSKSSLAAIKDGVVQLLDWQRALRVSKKANTDNIFLTDHIFLDTEILEHLVKQKVESCDRFALQNFGSSFAATLVTDYRRVWFQKRDEERTAAEANAAGTAQPVTVN